MKHYFAIIAACAMSLSMAQASHAQTTPAKSAVIKKPAQVVCVQAPCNQPGQPTKPKTGMKSPDSKRTVPQLPQAKRGNKPG